MAELKSSLLNPDMDEIEEQLGMKRMELERQGLSKADIEVQLSIERARLMLMTQPASTEEEGTLLGGSEFWKVMDRLRRNEQTSSAKQTREYSRERILDKMMKAREKGMNTTGMFYNKDNWVEIEKQLDAFLAD